MSRPPLILALLLALTSGLGVSGVEVEAATGPPDVPGLVELAGREAFVLYTPGSLDRASRVQDWLETLGDEYAGVTGERVRLGAYLLDRREWESADLGAPYGFPRSAGRGRTVLPAFGDQGTVTLWRRYQPEGLPAPGGSPVRGTPEEAASLFTADLWGLFETARGLVLRGPVRGEDPWIDELMAHALAVQALERRNPRRAASFDRFWSHLGRAAMDSVSRGGTEASETFDRWVAHQSRLHELARSMADREGRRGGVFSRLWRLGRKSDGILTEDGLRRRYRDSVPLP
ncbi:MAG: hypothetical protein R3234_01970 [Thermoanaerobaculia bacterium]|nr:hypothetical protein [Thermoanaerobaculia bacterium]